MKTTKRFIAMAAALTLTACAAMPMASFAEDPTYTITVTDSNGFTHSGLKAFQIFDGNNTTTGFNVTGWGDGINVTNFITALKAELPTSFPGTYGDDAAGAVAVSDIIATFTSGSSNAETVARCAANNVKGNGAAAVSNEITVGAGYYVVVDTADATKTDSGRTIYEKSLGMLKVTTDTPLNVSTKIDYPTLTKEINDINDTSDAAYVIGETDKEYTSGGTWGSDADHDIGDDVPFKLTGTIPSNYDKYKTYKMVFTDDLNEGAFNLNANSIKVYLVHGSSRTDITSSATINKTKAETADSEHFTSNKTDGKSDFTVTFNDLKTAVPAAAGGDSIVVEYTAQLTSGAVCGSTGNWNSAFLTYSNNPNYTGTGADSPTGDTPEVLAVDFTYKVVINKKDGATGADLDGATFKLSKKNSSGAYVDVATIVGTNAHTFNFTGLDDGDYKLEETAKPSQQYNDIAPIEFTIAPVHNNKALVSLNGQTASGTITLGGTSEATADPDTGKIEATVLNNKGTNLPSTGGIGTTLFILGGGCAAGLAGIYLVSKKKTREEE